MTREIKFRAWDKKNNMWHSSWASIFPWGTQPSDTSKVILDIMPEYFEFSQYTGLLDKNGKEIYESDYLGEYCVFWGGGKYILQNISTGDIIDCNENTTYNKEVTGNRYENPGEHKAVASDL